MQTLKKATQTEMGKEPILHQSVHEGKGRDQQIWKEIVHQQQQKTTVILHSPAMVEAKTPTPCVRKINRPPACPCVRVNPQNGENGGGGFLANVRSTCWWSVLVGKD